MFTIEQVAQTVGGKYYGNHQELQTELQGVETDNRRIQPGYLFVPIKGERFDGHQFIDAAYEAGAICTLSEKKLEGRRPYILVPSAEEAFRTLAEAYAKAMPAKMIGITGSAGKTTTKEMTAGVLSQCFRSLKTEGNLNNQIGVPLTVCKLTPTDEVAVIEMGTNHFGEIATIAKIVRPDIALLTNIGLAHIEHFGSKSGVLKAKSEMLEYVKPNGHILINGDDPQLQKIAQTHDRVTTFGLQPTNDVYASNMDDLGLSGITCTIHASTSRFDVHIPSPGEHMIYNALAAAACGLLLHMDPKHIVAGIEGYRPVGGRMAICHAQGITVLDDTYNANPQSMVRALDVLSTAKGRTLAVLGDMYELGEDVGRYHTEIGVAAAQREIDTIIAVGDLALDIYRGARQSGARSKWYKTQDMLLAELATIVQPGDTILVKASRGMQLEQTVDKLLENGLF